MSLVTNVILTFSLLEQEIDPEGDNPTHKIIQAIHASQLLKQNHRGVQFKRVDNFTTGPKAFEHVVYLAAFNYLDHNELISLVRQLPWEAPYSVQLWINGQEDDGFTLYSVDDS